MHIGERLIVLITILAAGGHYAYAQTYDATSRANITAYGGKADNGVTDNGLALNRAIEIERWLGLSGQFFRFDK